MILEYFLVFHLLSTPAGDELLNNGYYVLEKCTSKTTCSKRVREYNEAWPFLSQFGKFLVMAQETAF